MYICRLSGVCGHFAIFKALRSSFIFITLMHNVHDDFPLYRFREPLDARHDHHCRWDFREEESEEDISVSSSDRLAS